MRGIIKLTKKNHLALKNHFRESLSIIHQQPIPKGKKYWEMEKENKIISLLFESHENQKCICNDKTICLFKKYENKKITIEEVVDLMT